LAAVLRAESVVAPVAEVVVAALVLGLIVVVVE
jgi:hypothetical protein